VSSDRLIFISGWASDASCWNSIIETIDRPVCCRHVDWWECLNDTGERNALRQILEQEKSDVIIVGWSLGALTALEGFVCKPNSVKTLVLISGTSRMTSEGSYPGVDARILSAMNARLRRTPRLVLEEFARLCIDDGLKPSPETDSFIDTFVEQALRLNSSHLTAGLAYLQKKDLRCILPKINIPVHLVHGDCDRVIPVECAQYMQSKLPKSRLVEIHGGSHALLYSAPFRVAGFIREAVDANFNSR
jgi:pimeloyl-[acyl-carrier protein] methyl ester esterase